MTQIIDDSALIWAPFVAWVSGRSMSLRVSAREKAENVGVVGTLRLEWEDACLNPHRGEGQVRTASAWQVREPLYTGSSGRWRNYRDHIDPLVDAFGPPEDA